MMWELGFSLTRRKKGEFINKEMGLKQGEMSKAFLLFGQRSYLIVQAYYATHARRHIACERDERLFDMVCITFKALSNCSLQNELI